MGDWLQKVRCPVIGAELQNVPFSSQPNSHALIFSTQVKNSAGSNGATSSGDKIIGKTGLKLKGLPVGGMYNRGIMDGGLGIRNEGYGMEYGFRVLLEKKGSTSVDRRIVCVNVSVMEGRGGQLRPQSSIPELKIACNSILQVP